MARLVPASLSGYQRSWLRSDILAGVTLAAVAIPETMGYTSIAKVPVVTGLYTVIFPTIVFALLCSSRLLVVGADSATAAILAAGLASLGIVGLTPNSPEWLAFSSLVALVCGGMLATARLLKLGFLGDFLSASVLIGFLSGVGISVLAGQIPDMLGIPKGSGNWFQQQWSMLTHVAGANLPTVAFAVGALAVIIGLKRFLPRVPGAIIAVLLSIVVSAALDAHQYGVAIVGEVQGGFPPLGLPAGITWSDVPKVLGVAFSCFVLIIAQSAATSRSFAMRHGETVDVNRDILGLSGASVMAGLSGTFVVNGSPTKTQILDERKGRTQLASITMSFVVLVVVLFLSGLLTDMPKAVLAAIVFLVGLDLVDLAGLRRILRARPSEFVIAALTGVVVFTVGVEQGIILAVALSILEMVRRQYRPKRFVVGVHDGGKTSYTPAVPGLESLPGLLVFRYDADLFYANAHQFSDDVQQMVVSAPDPIRWLVLDCSAIPDVDYSAALSLEALIDFVHARQAVFALAGLDPDLRSDLERQGVLAMLHADHLYDSIPEAVAAFRGSSRSPGRLGGDPGSPGTPSEPQPV